MNRVTKEVKMRLAIIGTGIAGNASAYALVTGSTHDITVFEKSNRAGGHSATVDIDYDGVHMAVDTGFIVYNEVNYPLLTALFRHLDIETVASDMSFALSAENGGFEWSGRTTNVLDGLFAQRSNIVSPRYLKMLIEITRFNRSAVADLTSGKLRGLSLGEYLTSRGYTEKFRDGYLLPMGAAIWSMSVKAMMEFPAESFVAFFNNHHLLAWDRPVWRTVKSGSRVYVERMIETYKNRLRLNAEVVRVQRDDLGVTIHLKDGTQERFDGVIFGSHSDESLAMLDNPSAEEREILGSVGYKPNQVYLHRDPALMPKRKRAWASWNVMEGEDKSADLCVSYWMNSLQALDPSRDVFVTLNPPSPPKPDLTFGVYSYDHPQFNRAAIDAQQRIDKIQGRAHSWYCGAWTRYGFHEDGLASGIAIAERLGAKIDWKPSIALKEAAE